MDENKKAVDECIANLNRIPKEIKTEIFIKDIIREVEESLKRDLKRRVSYT
jgi:lipoate-protein ligase A